MGHRNSFRSSQMFEMEHNENLNHGHEEQPFVHNGAARAGESGPFFFPAENMSTRVSHWNTGLASAEYPSSSIGMEFPHHQLSAQGTFYDPFVNSSAAGTFCVAPQNFSDCPSSSYRGHRHGVDDTDNSMLVNGRGPCKRKSPVPSAICDRPGSSSYYMAGPSSDLSASSNLQPEKLTLGSHSRAWDPMGVIPNYREIGPSVGESSQRNVRSRSALDLEMNLAMTHLSNDPYHHLHTSVHPLNHTGTSVPCASASATTHDWDQINASATGCGRIMPSGGLNHNMNQFPVVGSSGNGSMELSGHQHGTALNSNSVAPLHGLHSSAPPAGRGGCSSFAQRSLPGFRVPSSYSRPGYMSHEDGLTPSPDFYSSTHARPLSTIGWRGSERNGRSRIFCERMRVLSDDRNIHDRFYPENFVTLMDRATRSLIDQHRDMRLDVDSMSYEELLALGERIGNVSTGLSEYSISKCLKDLVYHPSQLPDERNCAICLEEYQAGEKIGMLVNCSHNYHVGCIKKWLLIKNVCPICKGPAMEDNLKK
ncbi:hypothetical protein Sjap_001565 [Stephania japonica]|uniref:RING-type E3 ubiquitin transferase n=1 Tax=Stephania japonica TaxID=461633 RepID=A0AAP0KL32_9MAGN